MFPSWCERTAMVIGEDGLKALSLSHVAVFGLGGVGSYATESLARSCVGKFTIVDADTVKPSNINRQLIALHNNIGQTKCRAQTLRIREINPSAAITAHEIFITPENIDNFDFSVFSYVVDAIDTISAKIALILAAQKARVPVISAMGCGNKLSPAMLEVADIYDTSVCPLARVMRRELKKRGADHFKVVYSKEPPVKPFFEAAPDGDSPKLPPGSLAFVPGTAGLIMGAQVVKDLTGLR